MKKESSSSVSKYLNQPMRRRVTPEQLCLQEHVSAGIQLNQTPSENIQTAETAEEETDLRL